jgi:DNA-binding MarR family transcriptional regulator
MDIAMVSVVALTAGGVSYCAWKAWGAIKNAPEGYEDASGFNYGEQPLPALTPDQMRVIAEMHCEISYPVSRLAEYTGLPEKTVTRVRKELRDLGLVEYGHLRGDGGESHEIAGRGYWLTDKGLKARDALGVRGA